MHAEKFLITSLRRTGGTLVARLLDGHPECSVFPFEQWNTRRKATYDPLANRLFRWLPASAKLAQCGAVRARRKKFEVAHGEARWPAFHGDLLDCARRATSPAELYDRSAEVYFRGYHPGGLQRVLVNHCASLCLMTSEQIASLFGRTRTIITARDPRASFVSTAQRHLLEAERKGRGSPASTTRAAVEAFCGDWRRAMARYSDGDPGTIALRFEDLVTAPRKSVEELATAMGIRFHATLLEPTTVSRPIGANTSFARESGIDASAATDWRERLEPQWRRLIEDRLGDSMEKLGYAID